MFLRNFDHFMLAYMGACDNCDNDYASGRYYGRISSGELGDATAYEYGFINVKTTAGTVSKFRIGTSDSYSSSYTMPLALSDSAICLGTGDTAVTYEDYKLAGDILDNMNLVYKTYNVSWNDAAKAYIKTVQYTYTNNTNADVTIREWGLFTHLNGGSSRLIFNNKGTDVLMYREVLDNPVTIEPQSSATLTFAVCLPMSHYPAT